MTKFLSVVISLITLMLAGSSFADDGMLGFSMKTKQIVRMKLWYEGLSEPQEQTKQDQESKGPKISEELNRALNKAEF